MVIQNLIDSQSFDSVARTDRLIELALTCNWRSSEAEVQNAILAYYLSGVMNFGIGPLANDNTIRSTEGTSYYYQYMLSQTNMLKPAGR